MFLTMPSYFSHEIQEIPVEQDENCLTYYSVEVSVSTLEIWGYPSGYLFFVHDTVRDNINIKIDWSCRQQYSDLASSKVYPERITIYQHDSWRIFI